MKHAIRSLAAILVLALTSVAAFGQYHLPGVSGNPSPIARPGGGFYAPGFFWTGRVISGNSSTGSASIIIAGSTGGSGGLQIADGTTMEGSNVTAGTAVQLSNIQITQTLTAAASLPFCQDITTTVAAASATGGTITPGMGWLTEGQVAAGTIHTGASNILFAAVGSLNLALNAKLEVVYNHTTGTDGGAGVLLINPRRSRRLGAHGVTASCR